MPRAKQRVARACAHRVGHACVQDEKVEEEEPPEVVVSLEEALEEALEGKDMDDVDEYADDADGDDTFMAEYRYGRSAVVARIASLFLHAEPARATGGSAWNR